MKRIIIITLTFVISVLHVTAQERYTADIATTNITWTGKKIGKEHVGTIGLKEGWLTVEKNVITGGEFIVDMNTIRDTELKDEKMRGMLEGHLKSDDFFGVETYPVSRLVVTGSGAPVNGKATVKGNLTIKAKTHPVEFTAVSEKSGDVITYTADLSFDRSLFDVRYGSGKFFSNLGDQAISDNIDLNIKLVVRK